MQQQHKGKMQLFFWFMSLMGKYLPIYLCAIFISTFGLAFSKIANAWIVEDIITAAQTRSVEGLTWSVILNFGFFVLAQLIWRFGIIRYNIEGKRGIANLEKMVFTKAMRLPYAYYEEHHSADFMSKLTFDVERAGDIYGSRLRRLSAAVISSIIYLIPMFCDSWQLTLCLFMVSLLSIIVNGLFTTPMKEAGSKLSKQHSVMLEKLTNILAGMELVKIFPVGRRLDADYQEINETYYQTQMKTGKLSAALESLNCLFDLIGALAFLGLGIYFVSQDMVTLGELTAIYTLYGSFRYVFLEIGRYLPQMMNCLANVERLYDFLQLEEEETQVVQQNTVEMNIQQNNDIVLETQNLSFSYQKERRILKNFSLKVKKGSFVAITGESGCGKSTLAKLILGYYKPEKGVLNIFGKDYMDCSLEEIREQIAYVPQEPYLYEVSIAENIAYGKSNMNPENVPMEDIIAAAKAANAHDFIMKLPQGYDTIPGERGNTLSGGEKQRIAIARAVLKNAPILLLDEATSALDNESEKLVNESIKQVCKTHTTIMIAHRPSTIAMADTVVKVG